MGLEEMVATARLEAKAVQGALVSASLGLGAVAEMEARVVVAAAVVAAEAVIVWPWLPPLDMWCKWWTVCCKAAKLAMAVTAVSAASPTVSRGPTEPLESRLTQSSTGPGRNLA